MRRPGVVTFIGVILYIQAFLAAIVAIVGIAFKNRLDDFTRERGQVSGDGILAASIVEGIMAVILFAVASGLMQGSRGFRTFVAIVEGLRIASSLGFMIYHHSGAYVEAALVSILISVFVLWALYHGKADEYSRRSAETRANGGPTPGCHRWGPRRRRRTRAAPSGTG